MRGRRRFHRYAAVSLVVAAFSVASPLGAHAQGSAVYVTSNGTTVNVAGLLADGFTMEELRSLDLQVPMINMLVSSGTATVAQAQHLAQSLLATPPKLVSAQTGPLPSGVVLPSFPAGPLTSCSSGTGAYYDVYTGTGWNEATAYTTMGDSTSKSSSDGFYDSLGLWSTTNNVGADIGLGTPGSGSSATWTMYENGPYGHWDPSSGYTISQATYPEVYLELTIPTTSYLGITVIDPTTWTVLYNPDVYVGTSYGFTTSGANEEIYRFDSIAQNGGEDLTDGSSLTEQSWTHEYEYNSNGYQLVTSYGREAGPECTAAEKATVSVNSYTAWYDSNISVSYS